MKKLTAILTCIAMLMLLVACRPISNAHTDTQPKGTEGNAAQSDEMNNTEETSGGAQAAGFATSREEFLAKLDALVDLSKYEEFTMDDEPDYICFTLLEDCTCEMDYTVSFSDGWVITLPVTFGKMADDGWVTDVSADFAVSNKVQRIIEYTNGAGEKIELFTTNMDEIGNPEDVTCPLSDCTFYKLRMNLYALGWDENDKPYYEALENAPAFSMFGSLSQKSTVEDVIGELGLPYEIEYDGEYNEITVKYMQEINDEYTWLYFYFVADGNYIYEVDYSYN